MSDPVIIHLDHANAYQRDTYGILYTSRFVYRQAKRGAGPTRIEVWDNTGRPYDADWCADGWEWRDRPAMYLDPHNCGTDASRSILAVPESVSINDTRTGTGHPDSGQVYAPETLADRERVVLVFPDGGTQYAVINLPPHANGHGYLTFF